MPIFHTSNSFKSYRFLSLSLERFAFEFPAYSDAFPVTEIEAMQQAISESFYLHAALALYTPEHFDRFFDPITLQRTPPLSFRSPQSYSFEVIARLKILIETATKPFISPERTPTESFYQILDLAIARIETSQQISLQGKGDDLCLYELDIMSEVKDITGFCNEHIELLFYAPASQSALLWWSSAPRPEFSARLQPLSRDVASLIQTTEKRIYELTESYWDFINQKDLEAFRRMTYKHFLSELDRRSEGEPSLLDLIFTQVMSQIGNVRALEDYSEAITSRILECLEGQPMIEALSFSLSAQTAYENDQLFYQETIARNNERFDSLPERIQVLYIEALQQSRMLLMSVFPKEICSFMPYDLLAARSDSPFSEWVSRRFPSTLEEFEEHRALLRVDIHSTMSFRAVPTEEDVEDFAGTEFIDDFASEHSDYSHAAQVYPDRAQSDCIARAHWEAIVTFFAKSPWSFYPLSDSIRIFHHLLSPDLTIDLMKSNMFLTVVAIIGEPERFFIRHVAHDYEQDSWINPLAIAHYACALQNPSMTHLILQQEKSSEELHALCLEPFAIEGESNPRSLLERALGLSKQGGSLVLYILSALSAVPRGDRSCPIDNSIIGLLGLKTSCGSTIAIRLIDSMHDRCQDWLIERLNDLEPSRATELLGSYSDNRRTLLSAIMEHELERTLSPEIRAICGIALPHADRGGIKGKISSGRGGRP